MLVLSAHIVLTVECEECGEEWTVDDNDSQDIQTAMSTANELVCLKCFYEERGNDEECTPESP